MVLLLHVQYTHHSRDHVTTEIVHSVVQYFSDRETNHQVVVHRVVHLPGETVDLVVDIWLPVLVVGLW